MPQTNTFSLPYPNLTDPPNGAAQIQALAEATDGALSGIDTRLTAAETIIRCRVRFTGNFFLSANTDLMAQGGWFAVSGEDPLSMFSIAGDGLSQIRIPAGYGGLWAVSFHIHFSGSTGSRMAGINRNTTSTTSGFILRDPRPATPAGGDGTQCRAYEEVVLADNDVLRWVTWSSVDCTVGDAFFDYPGAEIYVRRIGA